MFTIMEYTTEYPSFGEPNSFGRLSAEQNFEIAPRTIILSLTMTPAEKGDSEPSLMIGPIQSAGEMGGSRAGMSDTGIQA